MENQRGCTRKEYNGDLWKHWMTTRTKPTVSGNCFRSSFKLFIWFRSYFSLYSRYFQYILRIKPKIVMELLLVVYTGLKGCRRFWLTKDCNANKEGQSVTRYCMRLKGDRLYSAVDRAIVGLIRFCFELFSRYRKVLIVSESWIGYNFYWKLLALKRAVGLFKSFKF